MRLAFMLALLFTAPAAHAAGISGSIFGSTGAPMYPCDIDVFDRSSGAPIAVTGDSTLPNGNYAVTLKVWTRDASDGKRRGRSPIIVSNATASVSAGRRL